MDWYAKSAEDLAADVGFAWSPLVGTPPDCIACFFRQDWVRPDGDVDPADELRLQPVPVTIRGRRRRRPLEVRPAPRTVPVAAPERRGAQCTRASASGRSAFDHRADDLAIEFDDRFTALGDGAQLAVFLDERQVAATAADWAGRDGKPR